MSGRRRSGTGADTLSGLMVQDRERRLNQEQQLREFAQRMQVAGLELQGRDQLAEQQFQRQVTRQQLQGAQQQQNIAAQGQNQLVAQRLQQALHQQRAESQLANQVAPGLLAGQLRAQPFPMATTAGTLPGQLAQGGIQAGLTESPAAELVHRGQMIGRPSAPGLPPPTPGVMPTQEFGPLQPGETLSYPMPGGGRFTRRGLATDVPGKGLSGESAGKLAMLQLAEQEVRDAMQMLFPDGTPRSQRQDILLRTAVPLGLGQLGSTEAQDLASRLDDAIASKLRAETGVAARPEEVVNIRRRFEPRAWLTPEANFDRMQRLVQYLGAGRSMIDPTGRFGQAPPIGQGAPSRGQGALMVDAQGNRAMVYPDGSYEELP